MKRILNSCFLIIITALILTSCNTKYDLKSYDVIVEGSIFSGTNDEGIKLKLNYSDDWLTKADNNKYNNELAAFSTLLCADSYYREKDLSKGTQNRVLFEENNTQDYTPTLMLETLGFSDTCHIESYKEKVYKNDTNDSVTLNMGYKNVDGKYDLFIVSIRGCFSAGEWASVFDIGDTSQMLGEHLEWKNKENFKGFDVASNRALEFIDEYIDSHNFNNAKKILITGHSRGATIANLIGAHYEKEKNIDSFTYTFNAGLVTNDRTAREYETIFNVFDANDIFTNIVPFKEEEFMRYGTDIVISIKENDAYINKLEELKGRNDYLSLSNEDLDEYAQLFNKLFLRRSSLLNIITKTEVFNEFEAANERIEYLLSAINKSTLGIEELFGVNAVEESDEQYLLTYKYFYYSSLMSLGKIFPYGETGYNYVKEVFKYNTDVLNIADFYINHLNEINGGHYLINSYVIATMS